MVSIIVNLSKQGNDKPVIPGLMPPTNLSALIRMANMNGSHLPKSIIETLSSVNSKQEREEFAKDIILKLVDQLISNGAPGVHIYTMNNVELSKQILNEITI